MGRRLCPGGGFAGTWLIRGNPGPNPVDAFDAVMLILDRRGDADLGRTAIQKLAYLAGRKIPSLEIPDYSMQYYGPFSEELDHVLEKLVSHSFVAEKKMPGDAAEMYSYALTGDGAAMVQDMAGSTEMGMMESLMEGCRTACNFEVPALLYAARILHACETGVPYRESVRRAKESEWDLYPGGTGAGARVLEELGLDNAR